MSDLPQNKLLASLPAESLDRVMRRMEPVELVHKVVLAQPHEPIEHLYFPAAGVISVVMSGGEGMLVEVATIGREGFAGTPVLLGTDESPTEMIVQIPGRGHRMSSGDFREAVESDAPLRRLLMRYTQALMTQMAQSATCNRVHNIEERAARWLLMTRDRVDEDTFPLTQEFLGQMLGVRRQAVNVAAGMLQQAGLIAYNRGHITVLDRKGLEESACECYAVILNEHRRLLGAAGEVKPGRRRPGTRDDQGG